MSEVKHFEFDVVGCPLEGTAMIEASAGTGKTYSIAALVLRLILEKDISIDKILVVTFTKAATAELKDRIGRFLNEAQQVVIGDGSKEKVISDIAGKYKNDKSKIETIRSAILSLDEAAVFTIHGFCKRVLEENAFETGSVFNSQMMQSQNKLIEEIVADFFRKNICSLPEDIYLQAQKKLSFESLKKFIKNFLRNDAHVEAPAPVCSIEEISTLIKKQTAYVESLRNLWREEKDKIIDTIKNWNISSPYILNKNKDLNLLTPILDGIFSKSSLYAATEIFDKNNKLLGNNNLYLSKTYLEGKTKNKYIPHNFFELMDELKDISAKITEAVDAFVYNCKAELYAYVKIEAEKRKAARNTRHYDDLLLQMRAALQDKAGKANLLKVMRDKYKAVLIDEFQDTDSIQYDIFKELFDYSGGRLFLIGDPKQSIYRFRGADIFSYITAKQGAKIYTMNTNYRSADNLIAAFNKLFDKDDPFMNKDIVYKRVIAPDNAKDKRLVCEKEDKPLIVWKYAPEKTNQKGTKPSKKQTDPIAAAAVADEIIKLLNPDYAALEGEPVKASDIAVLAASHLEVDKIAEAFRDKNIPYITTKTKNVFSSQEARELCLILRAITDPTYEKYINGALLTNILGEDAKSLSAMNETEKIKHTERFHSYRSIWEQQGFVYMFMKLLADYNVRVHLLMQQTGQRSLTNVLHLAELIHNKAAQEALGITELFNWFSACTSAMKPAESWKSNGDRDDVFIGSGEENDSELRLERDDNAVTIMTIHGSKGLEFPIVFAPYLGKENKIKEDNFFYHSAESPDGKSKLILAIGDKDEEHKTKAKAEDLEERLRLFYVAVTRARSRCYLFHSTFLEHEHKETKDKPEVSINNAEDFFLKDREKELSANEHIKVAQISFSADDSKYESSDKKLSNKLTALEFTAKINRSWKIASFTSISREAISLGSADDEPEYEDIPFADEAAPVHTTRAALFPKGRGPGDALHKILEKTNFNEKAKEDLVKEVLLEYGLAEETNISIAAEMINNTCEAKLPADEPFRLCDVDASSKISELEFWLAAPADIAANFSFDDDKTNTTKFDPLTGYIHGYIDLFFQHKGKYYIADWKSNYFKEGDYTKETMHDEMIKHKYDMQYMIYAAAVHNYLKKVDPSYSFDKNFGGVFYIFLRGTMQGESKGVYYVPPEIVKSQCTSAAANVNGYFLRGGNE